LPEERISIDGIMNEPSWEKASPVKEFYYPWEQGTAPPAEFEFRSLCDDQSLYFSFSVDDKNVF
jgi:hypothetical protein